MANPVLRQGSGFSIAAAGARMGAGQGGLYKKSAASTLYNGSGNVNPSSPLILSAYVNCPSSRIKVAFGVGGKGLSLTDGATSPTADYGTSTFWNVIPQVAIPAVQPPAAVGGATPEQDNFISGRPLFWMAPAVGDDNAPPHAETSNASAPAPAAGFTAGASIMTPENSLELGQYGRLVPDAYEAVSAVDRYKIILFVAGVPTSSQLPIVAWASWEILDPRDQEDTEALLAKCSLDAGPTVHTP